MSLFPLPSFSGNSTSNDAFEGRKADVSVVVGYGFLPYQGGYWLIDHAEKGGERRKIFFLNKRKVAIRKLKNSYCRGRYDWEIMRQVLCLEKRQVGGNVVRCISCRNHGNGGDFPALDQQKNKEESHHKRPHDVYLAYFVPGVIRVGIACRERLYTDLVKEGAQAALVVHEAKDFHGAQRMAQEMLLQGLCASMVFGKKATWISHIPYQRQVALNHLRDVQYKLYKKMGNKVAFSPLLYEFQETYWPDGAPEVISVGSKLPDFIRGQVMGMVGSLLALKIGKECMLFETRALMGRLSVDFE